MEVITNRSAILLAFALLAGCASQPISVPEKVEIPVCPTTIISTISILPKRPALPIASMDNGNSDTVLKAYAASVRALEGYAKELEDILKQVK